MPYTWKWRLIKCLCWLTQLASSELDPFPRPYKSSSLRTPPLSFMQLCYVMHSSTTNWLICFFLHEKAKYTKRGKGTGKNHVPSRLYCSCLETSSKSAQNSCRHEMHVICRVEERAQWEHFYFPRSLFLNSSVPFACHSRPEPKIQKIHVYTHNLNARNSFFPPRRSTRKIPLVIFKWNQTNRDPERGISVSRVFGKLWSTSSGGVGRAKHMGREWEQGTSELQSELTPDSSHAILRHAMYKRMHEPGNPQDLYSFTHQSFIPLRDIPDQHLAEHKQHYHLPLHTLHLIR